MPSQTKNLDQILSNLGDDDNNDDLASHKKKRRSKKHVSPNNQRPKLRLHDFYRSSVRGEGIDLFIQTKIFQDYLQCEVTPWTYPKRST